MPVITHNTWKGRNLTSGGVGIINTKIMNECLLVKWIWKIHQEPDELWFKLIKAKYLDGCSFFTSKSKGGSQFW